MTVWIPRSITIIIILILAYVYIDSLDEHMQVFYMLMVGAIGAVIVAIFWGIYAWVK